MIEQGRGRARLSIAADMASLVSALVLVVVGFVLVASAVGRPARARPASDGLAPSTVTTAKAEERLVTRVVGLTTHRNATATGSTTAKVAIVEFTDFECPFCGRYARDTYPLLKTEFVDTGRVAYVVRSFPIKAIHRFAFRASEAAECAREQGKFWEMYDRLFMNQDRLAETDLIQHARAIGVTGSRFQGCLHAGRSAVPKADHAEGVRLGIRSTPTLLIGPVLADGSISPRHKIVGALPYEVFRATIEQALVDANAVNSGQQ